MKVFATLFFSLFAAVTGVGIVVPLLPVYAHSLGAGGIYIALIFASFSLTRTVFLPCFGRLSDRMGRKPFIVTGLGIYALVSIAFILFSRNVESLIAIRFVQGIASAMIMPAVQAYVGEIAPKGGEGRTMGRFNLSLFLGLSLGPLIGGALNDRFDMNAAFICMGLAAALGCLLSVWLLPPVRSEAAVRRKTHSLPWGRLLRDGDLAALFIVRMMYALCIGMVWSFLPVLADAEFHFSAARIGLLVTLGVLVSGLTQTPMGYLADRANRKFLVIVGGLIAAAAVYGIELAPDFGSLAAASILFGVGGGIVTSAIMALAVVRGNRAGAMGAVMGLINMGHSIGMLLGALLAGLMMEVLQLRFAFSAGAALLAGSVVVFMIMTRPRTADTDPGLAGSVSAVALVAGKIPTGR
ncbi:MAG: MFS transporter [Desulfobacterales bacterium]|nr:MAG: MFS transporter [Desulfobacterales bacterium]